MYHQIREISSHSNKKKCIRALNLLNLLKITMYMPHTFIFISEHGVTYLHEVFYKTGNTPTQKM